MQNFNNLVVYSLLESTDQVCGARIDTVLITEPAHITSSFTMSALIQFLAWNSNSDWYFTNTSANAVYYAWNFGNGNFLFNWQNPTAVLETPGTYLW
ncbi:MAG: hypothetical protein IPG07_12490 [Crocinitomicaceae bacterium]|nr:hypothetical protein [Crocinitomicaceae bacterium]